MTSRWHVGSQYKGIRADIYTLIHEFEYDLVFKKAGGRVFASPKNQCSNYALIDKPYDPTQMGDTEDDV